MFSMCPPGYKVILSEQGHKREPVYTMVLRIRYVDQGMDSLIPTKLIAKTEGRGSPKQVTLRFDACAAINAYPSGGGSCGSLGWEQSYATEHKYLCQKTYWCYDCTYWSCVTWATWKNDKNDSVHLVKGRDITLGCNVPCISGHCNPVELIITDPKWEKGESVVLGIDGKGHDPEVSIQIQGKVQKLSARPVYQHFYDILDEPIP
ncbi:hypothetical protein AAY473_019106 [Plecturocebus cupreus]